MTTEAPDLDTYRRSVRSWLDANMEPRPLPPDRGHHTLEEVQSMRTLQRRLFDGGYAGITWPREYGGQGLTVEHEEVFNQEARDFHVPVRGLTGHETTLFDTTFDVVGPMVLAYGSDELKRERIPQMLAGAELWAEFFSEPEAGSDLAGVRTTAVRDGDSWILNGCKIWSSFAHWADFGMCLARTDWDVPKHRGLTWFAVPTKSPGLTMRPIKESYGESDFNREDLDDVVVPDHHRVGEVNEGWRVATSTILLSRTSARGAAPLIPSGPGVLAPDLVELARRVDRIDDVQVRRMIVQAHTNAFAQKALSYLMAARREPSGGAYTKLAMGTYTPMRAQIGLEIAGGAALAVRAEADDAASVMVSYLNGRIPAIAAGSDEMQRNAISERALQLPREPSYDVDKPFAEVVAAAKEWAPPRS
jgi:alkylation response protein AidB-like acyl-CoA dehydrogenase